jgi:predicted DNA-binding transcriptional regulator YafY
MIEERPSDAEQTRRVIYIFNELLSGVKLTSAEIHEKILQNMNACSLRTIQRDIKLLQDIIPGLENEKVGHQWYWYISKEVRMPKSILKVSKNELFLFHLLKAHLKSFNGTKIQDDIDKLISKIEKFAPGEVYLEESLYWDHNIGMFDYTEYNEIIQEIIQFINFKKFVTIKYNTAIEHKEKIYDVLLRKLFQFEGSLYVVALMPKYNTHISLKIQNIKSIKTAIDQSYFIPFFNYEEFIHNRFGVYESHEIYKVVLLIQKSHEEFFVNRLWHPSQEFIYQKNGDLHLIMNVPIVPEFLAWLASWCEHIKIIAPKKLIKEFRNKLEIGLKNNS